VKAAHRSLNHQSPLAYFVIVVPLSIPRFLTFNFHNVSSAATFFGVTMFNFSGVINVFLFLIARPQLLFLRPDELAESEMEPAPQGTSSSIFSHVAKFRHSPEPTSAALKDGGSRDIATPSHVNPRQISDDISSR
jgi:hypothetical protein